MKVPSLLFSFYLIFQTFCYSQADLSLDITVDDTQADIGQIITFTILVRNDGPETTLDVEILARLPSGYEFISAEATGEGRYDQVSGIWSAGGLGVGITDRLRIKARVIRTTYLLFLAEVIASGIMDTDSIPNNGVDTDEDGITVDDPDDEDDGDGQLVIAGGSSGLDTSGGFTGECLAPITAESAFPANPVDEYNSTFQFDYRIESEINFGMGGETFDNSRFGNTLKMTYYVNSADGSIFLPGGDTGFFRTNVDFIEKNGTIDGAVWLANGQMVSYVTDSTTLKKHALTRESAQSASTRFQSDYLNMMAFFRTSLELAAVPDPMPGYVSWPSTTKGFRGEFKESYTGMTNVIDMFFDTSPTSIKTSCIMMGFLVGILKDVRSTKCNRLAVYTKIHIGGLDNYMEGILHSIKPIGITFDASAYEPGRVGGDPGTSGAMDQMDFEDKVRDLEVRKVMLQNERKNCMTTRCQERIVALLEELRMEKARVVCEYAVTMGYQSSVEECLRSEE